MSHNKKRWRMHGISSLLSVIVVTVIILSGLLGYFVSTSINPRVTTTIITTTIVTTVTTYTTITYTNTSLTNFGNFSQTSLFSNRNITEPPSASPYPITTFEAQRGGYVELVGNFSAGCNSCSVGINYTLGNGPISILGGFGFYSIPSGNVTIDFRNGSSNNASVLMNATYIFIPTY